MNIIQELEKLIARIKNRGEVKDMNYEEIVTALEEIETDLRNFSLVTAVTDLIAKVETLKAKVTPVVINAEAAGEQVAQDAEVVAADVQNAGEVAPAGSEGLVNPEVPEQPVAPVEPAAPVEPVAPVEPAVPGESDSTVN